MLGVSIITPMAQVLWFEQLTLNDDLILMIFENQDTNLKTIEILVQFCFKFQPTRFDNQYLKVLGIKHIFVLNKNLTVMSINTCCL
jgi:hypothetical protein